MSDDAIRKIAIAGVGGIGGYLCQHFYEFGAFRDQYPIMDIDVTLFDNDVVDNKNLLHQNFTQDDLGKLKTHIIAERYAKFFKTEDRWMTEKDFKDFDLVFCCVDSMPFRKKLYQYGWKHPNFRWIDGRCSSRNGAVFNSALPKEELEKYIDDSEGQHGCLLKFEKENNISHTLPIITAGMMLQTFLNLIRLEKTAKIIYRV